MIQLAELPQNAASIHHYYSRFCQSCLPATPESQNGAVSGNEATHNVTIDSILSTGTAYNPIDITCEATIATCICGAGLTLSDDGICQKCWVYFTVLAKAAEFKNEQKSLNESLDAVEEARKLKESIDSFNEAAKLCCSPPIDDQQSPSTPPLQQRSPPQQETPTTSKDGSSKHTIKTFALRSRSRPT